METDTNLKPNFVIQPEISQVLLSKKQIQNRVRELGEEISLDYSGKEPIAIAVLSGAAIFHADLIRSISIGVIVDFISVSSYQSSTTSSGVVNILKDVELNLEGKDILLVEDIIDTGLTIKQLITELKKNDLLQSESAASYRNRNAGRSRFRLITWDLKSQIFLLLALVWTMQRNTATCLLSEL